MPVPRTARHKASRRPSGRYLLWAVPVVIVLVVGGLYLGGVAGLGSPSVTGASDTALTSRNCSPAATRIWTKRLPPRRLPRQFRQPSHWL